MVTWVVRWSGVGELRRALRCLVGERGGVRGSGIMVAAGGGGGEVMEGVLDRYKVLEATNLCGLGDLVPF